MKGARRLFGGQTMAGLSAAWAASWKKLCNASSGREEASACGAAEAVDGGTWVRP